MGVWKNLDLNQPTFSSFEEIKINSFDFGVHSSSGSGSGSGSGSSCFYEKEKK